MRALINGQEGKSLSFFKESDVVFNLMLLNDDGTIPDGLDADAIMLEVYTDRHRSLDPIAEHTPAVLDDDAALYSVTLSPTDTVYGPGTYFAFAKRTTDGESPLVSFGNEPTLIVVK